MTAPTTRRRRGERVDPYDGPVALAAEILRGSADLRGARCTADPRLFDFDVAAEDLGLTGRERWERVKATCVGCPARGACWAWASELSGSRRPRGPLADNSADPFPAARRRAAAEAARATKPVIPCPAPGCTRQAVHKGLCALHRERQRRYPDLPLEAILVPPGQFRAPTEAKPPRQCEGIDCTRPIKARGMCQGHYSRWRRNPGITREAALRPLEVASTPPPTPPPAPPRPPARRGARRRIKPTAHRKIRRPNR